MSGTHAHALFVPGDSVLHAVRPECKLLAQLLFVFAVVATPREAFWAFVVYALILLTLMHIAGLSPRFVAKRLWLNVGSPENLVVTLGGRPATLGTGCPQVVTVTRKQVTSMSSCN